MTTAAETFYAITCDYPGCSTQYDGDEYTYSYDPYGNSDGAQDMGWLIQFEGKDYCPAHNRAQDDLGDDLVDGDDEHWGRRPLPDTIEDSLHASIGIILDRSTARFDRAIRDLNAASASERTDLEHHRRRAVQRQHREYIEADTTYRLLLSTTHHLRVRENELRAEAEALFGRAF